MSPDISLVNGTAWYLAFLFSTTVHEASHALAGLKLGDDTAHRGGQVTLDPIPHLRREPVGMVIVPIVSYVLGGWMIGWASAPYDPVWANRNPRRAAFMAAAGPASNLLLCLVSAILIRVGLMAGWFHVPGEISGAIHIVAANQEGLWSIAALLLSVFFYLNLLLFAFNLIPLPPLDGASLPLLYLPESAAARYTDFMRSPGLSTIGLIVAWQVFGPIANALFTQALNLLYLGHHFS